MLASTTVTLLQRCLPLLALAAVPVSAQTARGTITGTVTDTTGSIIPGVQVIITHTGTMIDSTTETTTSGQYTMPALSFGTYDITFSSEGFKTLVQRGVAVSATEVRRVDAQLEIGAITESIDVTAEIARLATDQPEVATTLESRNMLEMPFAIAGGGRTAENLVYKIVPGVSGSSWRNFIVGSTAFSKETLLDGASASMNRAGHFGEMSLSMEAIGEFKIQTSGVSAEYGRSQGAVFNYIMKSGTNDIHGSLYGMLRNEAFNANTFANNARGVPRATDRRHVYAFSFGGPIVLPKIYNGTNKTFFYSAYERYHESNLALGAPSRNAPIPDFLDGDFSRLLQGRIVGEDALARPVEAGAIYDPNSFAQMPDGRWIGDAFPGNRIPQSRFSRVARNVTDLLRRHYTPTVRDASGLIPLENNMAFPAQGIPIRDQWQVSYKVDHHISGAQKLSTSLSYNLRPRLTANPGGQRSLWDPNAEDGVGGPLSRARSQRLRTWYVRASWDWTASPTVLNHFQVFYNRFRNDNSNSHRTENGADVYGLEGIDSNGYPDIDLQAGPFINMGALGSAQEGDSKDNVWGALNTVSVTRGNHFVKFGFDWKHNLAVLPQFPYPRMWFHPRATAIPQERFSGTQTGFTFASFLLGIVDRAALNDPVGLGYETDYIGLFVQDDWKVTPKLTLNLGVRWDTYSPLREKHDRMSSWSLDVIDPISRLPGAMAFAGDCAECTGKRYFGSYDLNNFAPRIGLAYRPKSGMTVRAAYGVYFEAQADNRNKIGKSGFSAWGGTYNLQADPIDPWKGIFNIDDGFPTSSVYEPGGEFDLSWGNRNSPGMWDPQNGTMPYIQKWNLNIQTELATDLILDVGYLGTKGTGLRAGDIAALNQIDRTALDQFGRDLTRPVRSAEDAARYGVPYPYDGFRGTVASALRPYPQVRANSLVNIRGTPIGFSNTHQLQAVLDKRFSRGLTTYINYVWTKSLSNVYSSIEGEDGNKPLDYYNLALEKSVMQSDTPHMFKAYLAYDLPFGRSKRWGSSWHPVVDGFLGGWSISVIANYFSGQPLRFIGSRTGINWNGRGRRVHIGSGPIVNGSFDRRNFDFFDTQGESNRYLNKDLFSDIEPGTLGTSAFAYTQARGLGVINEDFGLQKNLMIGERMRFQLRAELLNTFNRHQVGGINTNVTSGRFGQVTSVTGNRTIQLGLRLDF